jgi:hypothetical protein
MKTGRTAYTSTLAGLKVRGFQTFMCLFDSKLKCVCRKVTEGTKGKP